MSDYNWCHGPECHTTQTQSRVRGSGDNKVLRTIKIKEGRYGGYQREIWTYFCNNRCLFDFIRKHITSIVAIAPRREALETHIKDPKKVTETNSYNNFSWTRTEIETRVDND